MSIKGYIFDYGGTLDTAGCHWGMKIWHAYEQLEVPIAEGLYREAYVYAERRLACSHVVLPDFSFRQVLDEKLKLQLAYLSDKGSLRIGSDRLSTLHQQLLQHLYEDVGHTVSRSRRVLQHLHERFPLALVSNFYGNMTTVLREFSLLPLFSAVIESAVVGVRKPDERIFKMGVQALRLEPGEVVVVGDSYDKDILPAHAIGCQTVWLRGEGWTNDTFDSTVPDRVIGRLEELLL